MVKKKWPIVNLWQVVGPTWEWICHSLNSCEQQKPWLTFHELLLVSWQNLYITGYYKQDLHGSLNIINPYITGYYYISSHTNSILNQGTFPHQLLTWYLTSIPLTGCSKLANLAQVPHRPERHASSPWACFEDELPLILWRHPNNTSGTWNNHLVLDGYFTWMISILYMANGLFSHFHPFQNSWKWSSRQEISRKHTK